MKVISEIASLCKSRNAAVQSKNFDLVRTIDERLNNLEAVRLPSRWGICKCGVIRDVSGKDKVEFSVCFLPLDEVGNTLPTQWLRVVVKPNLIDTISIRVLGNISKWDKEAVDEMLYDALLSEGDSSW